MDHIIIASHAIKGLKKKDAIRVALALDCAIAFGALSAHKNESLMNKQAVEFSYQEKLSRLKDMT